MARNLILAGTSALLNNGAKQFGPFCDTNDNVYAVVKTTATSIDVYKASDPTGGSWAAQDTSNNPSDTDNVNRYAAVQDGDTIHIAIYWARTGDDELRYYTFRMSDHASADTWNLDENIETPTDPPAAASQHPAIHTRSDGDVIVLYTGDMDKVMGTDYDRCDYARREGGTWTVGVNVGGDSLEANYHAVAAERAESDAVWFAYIDDTNGDLYAKSLSSANSLGSEVTISTTVAARGENAFGQKLAYYDDSGVEVVWFAFVEGTALKARALRDGSAQTTGDAAGDELTTSSLTFGLASNGTTAYCVYAENTTFDLLFSKNEDEGGWDTSGTAIQTGASAFHPSAEVIDHGGGNVLGVVWFDGVATDGAYYSEYALAAPPVTEKSGKMTLLGVQ